MCIRDRVKTKYILNVKHIYDVGLQYDKRHWKPGNGVANNKHKRHKIPSQGEQNQVMPVTFI